MTIEEEEELVTIEELLSGLRAGTVERLAADLGTSSREELGLQLSVALLAAKPLYSGAVVEANQKIYAARIGAWLINCECTRRGIPPCFRKLPSVDTESKNCRYDLTLWDAQWLVNRFPKHKVGNGRHQLLFKPKNFAQKLQFLFFGGRRTGAGICRELALTEDQQWECNYLQSGPIAKKRRSMELQQDGLWMRLTDVQRLKRDRGRTRDEQQATVFRRSNIWRCAFMAGQRPQRTANLYFMLTGEPMTRSFAAKQIEKVLDDLR